MDFDDEFKLDLEEARLLEAIKHEEAEAELRSIEQAVFEETQRQAKRLEHQRLVTKIQRQIREQYRLQNEILEQKEANIIFLHDKKEAIRLRIIRLMTLKHNVEAEMVLRG